MQGEDDLRGLAKIMEFMRTVSILLVLMHCYWFCYGFFKEEQWTLSIIDKVLGNFQRTAGLFSHTLYTKLFALVLLALSCLGSKGVKNEKITWIKIYIALTIGFVFFFLNTPLLRLPVEMATFLYIFTLSLGYISLLMAGVWMSRLLKNNLMDDVFNTENESFMQETQLMQNEYSVNLPTKFWYQKKQHNGWINIVNPFRATIVLGTPGSGKSYAIVNNYIKQQIEKGFSMYIYDFKFDDLSTIAYNHLLKHTDKYKVKPKFYIINFDDPRRSHRCNPINPDFMTDISDAYESAYTIMLNLNRSWIQKQGDFFVESPIILLAAIIWFLKIYDNGKYCTFPHAIELLNKKYADVFTILTTYSELENYLSPFMDAWQGGAQDQLQGQIASAKIPLSRMISPQLYWVMTGDDFSLDINNPKEPKILCVGNNPDRQNIYSAALGLYNSRIVKLINKKGQLKSSVIIDELPTIYFRGLDNLIATARSNKVAVCLGFQDYSQLTRDYGDKESKVIQNTVGNIFSGQVVGETAKSLSERFGKILQRRQSMTINRNDKSTSISTQLESLIPASKISTLTQGMFVGAVSDNFDERIEQKIFHAEIVVDNEKVAAETKTYQKIPEILSFVNEQGEDMMKAEIEANYKQIKQDIIGIVSAELERIKNDPDLQHLVPKTDDKKSNTPK
ncbi:conjugal transfer protein TraG [Flavobacterium ranwuense]|uniref:Conjugal transfer protein TraG n=1 Tax=Flavobacterium ranwuense TaxID=2541725 RepID=A0ABY2DWG6_9FLAO|nr:conjugal transfer protein MobC [Flavobacterium ranwuense]TDE29388.1 conjugal transfer protein TraG [Flavobacterium ranwuense]